MVLGGGAEGDAGVAPVVLGGGAEGDAGVAQVVLGGGAEGDAGVQQDWPPWNFTSTFPEPKGIGFQHSSFFICPMNF